MTNAAKPNLIAIPEEGTEAHRLLLQRLSDKFTIDPDGCWRWQRTGTKKGYGQFTMPKQGKPMKLAHRVLYELMVGPISEGMIIDHLCRNHACVNPGHLEVVTQQQNVKRGLLGLPRPFGAFDA